MLLSSSLQIYIYKTSFFKLFKQKPELNNRGTKYNADFVCIVFSHRIVFLSFFLFFFVKYSWVLWFKYFI